MVLLYFRRYVSADKQGVVSGAATVEAKAGERVYTPLIVKIFSALGH